jgi:hypothetical protein
MSARRTLPLGDALEATIEQMRQIAAHAGDTLLLAEGPPDPDALLLELCSEAAHHLRVAEAAYSARDIHSGAEWTEERRRRDAELMAEYYARLGDAKSPLRKATKLRAMTPAGIFAKALVVRMSMTGAAQMAMSLAEDMVACQALRATLWPAGGDVQP